MLTGTGGTPFGGTFKSVGLMYNETRSGLSNCTQNLLKICTQHSLIGCLEGIKQIRNKVENISRNNCDMFTTPSIKWREMLCKLRHLNNFNETEKLEMKLRTTIELVNEPFKNLSNQVNNAINTFGRISTNCIPSGKGTNETDIQFQKKFKSMKIGRAIVDTRHRGTNVPSSQILSEMDELPIWIFDKAKKELKKKNKRKN